MKKLVLSLFCVFLLIFSINYSIGADPNQNNQAHVADTLDLDSSLPELDSKIQTNPGDRVISSTFTATSGGGSASNTGSSYKFDNLLEGETISDTIFTNALGIEIDREGNIINAQQIERVMVPADTASGTRDAELQNGQGVSVTTESDEKIVRANSADFFRMGRTSLAGTLNLEANLNTGAVTAGSVVSASEGGSSDISMNLGSALSFQANDGAFALRQLGKTTATTDSEGKLKYLKTVSNANGNVFIIPGASTLVKLDNVDDGKNVEMSFEGSQLKLTLDRGINGNINNLIKFRTLDYDALLNSYRIGKKITVTSSKSNLEFNTFNFDEFFTTNGKSKLVFQEDEGLEYIEAAKGSIYTYVDKNDESKSFSLKFNEDFKLNIKKSVTELDYVDVNGYVDLVSKKIYLKGKVDYLRGSSTVYSSEDESGVVILTFDENFNIIDEARVESVNDFVRVNAGQYFIRQGSLREIYLPGLFSDYKNIINKISSDTDTPDALFNQNVLEQGNVKVYAKGCSLKILEEVRT